MKSQYKCRLCGKQITDGEMVTPFVVSGSVWRYGDPLIHSGCARQHKRYLHWLRDVQARQEKINRGVQHGT